MTPYRRPVQIRCGELLIAQKVDLQHGEWKPWVDVQCDFAYDTAKRYMKAARQKVTGVPFSTLSQLYGPDRPTRERADHPGSVDDGCEIADLERCEQQFGTIYADPPWLYGNQATRAATGNHYAGMPVDDVCRMPIERLAADNAHLHLWTTNGFRAFHWPKRGTRRHYLDSRLQCTTPRSASFSLARSSTPIRSGIA